MTLIILACKGRWDWIRHVAFWYLSSWNWSSTWLLKFALHTVCLYIFTHSVCIYYVFYSFIYVGKVGCLFLQAHDSWEKSLYFSLGKTGATLSDHSSQDSTKLCNPLVCCFYSVVLYCSLSWWNTSYCAYVTKILHKTNILILFIALLCTDIIYRVIWVFYLSSNT